MATTWQDQLGTLLKLADAIHLPQAFNNNDYLTTLKSMDGMGLYNLCQLRVQAGMIEDISQGT